MALMAVIFSVFVICSTAAASVVLWFTTVADIAREGVRQRSALPSVAGVATGVLCTIYGIWLRESNLIIAASIVCAGTQLFYFIWFVCHCEQDARHRWFAYAATGFFLVSAIIMLYVTNMKRYELFYGCACAVAWGLMAVAPLLNLPSAYREKTMANMPGLPICFVSVASGIAWAGYAATSTAFDHYIFWASIVEFVSGAIQMAHHVALKPRVDAEVPLLEE